MKLTIEDGRDSFYTFDTNRILLLTATDEEQINQVEFSTEENGETVSWTSDVLTGEDGIKYVQVPNEFLNGNYSRLVCYYVALDSKGEYTRQKEVFRIRARQEPEDYFLTYSERVTFASIKALTEQYKANASDSADLARRYAEESEDVNVEAGTYSSKHWSAKSKKKFQEIKDYVGSTSDPESALGSIESARASAVSDVNKQKTDSIEAVGTYTSNTAIPSVSQYVESTAKPALKTYGEQQIDAYAEGTLKPELDRYVNTEKKNVLDNYTSEKKSELDIYTENEKKAELDTHAEGLKEQLNAHTLAKTGELNEYTTGLKSELDGYTTAKEQVISEFTEQKKAEVQGVYQNDLNELKGDLENQILNEKTNRENSINELKNDLEAEMNARIEADTEHSTRLQKVEVASSVNRYEIDNLKAKAEGKLYRTETVEAEAYTVDVPSSVAPYAEMQKIGGKSVVWNQLRKTYQNKTEYGITVSPNSDGTVNVKGTATITPLYNQFNITDTIRFKRDGRKYYVSSNLVISNKIGISGYGTSSTKEFIFSDSNNSDWNGTVFISVSEGDVLDFSNLSFNIVDLTTMFGAGNEPTSEECKKIFSADYYPYDAGTIKSFPVRTVRSVGRNLCLAKDVYAGAGEYLETTFDGRDCIRFISSVSVKNKPIRFKENTQYTVSFDLKMVERGSDGISENVFTFYYTDGSSSILNKSKDNFTDWKRISITSDSNKTILYVGLISLDYRTYCYVSNFQLEEGSVATDYTPYKESTIDFSSVTSGLKSAGSVHDEWSNGKVTKRIGSVDLGTLDWDYNSTYSIFFAYPTAIIIGVHNLKPNLICSKYETVNCSGFGGFDSKDKITSIISATNAFMVKDTTYTNITEFKSAMSGVMLYYELATPTEETIPEIDNYIEVEGGGTLTFESDETVKMPVPSTTRFVVDLTSTTEETT